MYYKYIVQGTPPRHFLGGLLTNIRAPVGSIGNERVLALVPSTDNRGSDCPIRQSKQRQILRGFDEWYTYYSGPQAACHDTKLTVTKMFV